MVCVSQKTLRCMRACLQAVTMTRSWPGRFTAENGFAEFHHQCKRLPEHTLQRPMCCHELWQANPFLKRV